jgi:hypothetical protein
MIPIERTIQNVRNLMRGNGMELVCLRGSCLHLALLLRDIHGGTIMINETGDHVALSHEGNLYDIRGAMDPPPGTWRPFTERDITPPLTTAYSLTNDTNRATRRALKRKYK